MAASPPPPPPLPIDADLRGYDRMWLSIAAVRGSRLWLRCRREPGMAFAFVNLLMAAWHENPAASLPNSDEILADLAGISPRSWRKIREVILAEFCLASDGRWYHLDLAEAAEKAWETRNKNHQKTAAATAARLAKMRNVTSDVTNHVTSDVTSPSIISINQSDSSSLSSADAEPAPKPRAAPSRSRAPRANRTALSPDWRPSEEGEALAREKGLHLRETFEHFQAHHMAKGNLMADWDAAWRTWCCSPYGKPRTAPSAADKREASARENQRRIKELEARLWGGEAKAADNFDGFTLDGNLA